MFRFKRLAMLFTVIVTALAFTWGTSLKEIQADIATWGEVSTPSTPVNGQHRMYFKADNKLYVLDDTGLESEAGGNPFDQNLNTTDSPLFSSLDIGTALLSTQFGTRVELKTDAGVSANSLGVTIGTGAVSGASGVTGDIKLTVGQNTASGGASDTGDIRLTISPSTNGTQGDIIFSQGSVPSVGHVWTAKDIFGAGEWAAPAGGGGPYWPLTKLSTGAGSFEIGPNSLSAGLEIFANGEGYLDLDGDTVNFKKRPKPNATNTLDMGEAFASFKDAYLEDIKFYTAGGVSRGDLNSSATGLTLRNLVVNGNITLQADADDSRLFNQPTGTVDDAIATVKYVNDNVGGGGGDNYAFTSAITTGFVNSTINSTLTLPELDTSFTTNATSNPVEITLNGRFTALSTLTSGTEGDSNNFCSLRVKRSGTFVGLGDCANDGRSKSDGVLSTVCAVGTHIDVGAAPSTAYTYTVEIYNSPTTYVYSSRTCNWNGQFSKPTMVIRQAP